MPYIQKWRREEMKEDFSNAAGELNYAITKLCVEYLGRRTLNYNNINDVIGVLECAKQEFYRRVAVPYENQKMHDHGDVY